MTEILITGGAGNFGRTLANNLKGRGNGLRLFDLPSCDFSVFDGWHQTRIFKGDILDKASLMEALTDVDLVFHLAAVLPPSSEVNRDVTFKVNVEGTRTFLEARGETGKKPRIVFASSISVYGDTSSRSEPVGPADPVNPNDWYAESKVEAERILMESGLPYTNLRISAIVIPAFLDPPEPWPFNATQKIELLTLGDLVTALETLVDTTLADNKTLLLAGGQNWQMTGEAYVSRWGEIMEIPMDEMTFLDRPGWLNWYDTSQSQSLLDYQKNPPDMFFKQLQKVVDEELA